VIDLKLLRSEPEAVRNSLRRRGSNLDLDALLEADERYRSILGEVEALRAEQNRASKAIGSESAPDRDAAIKEAKLLSKGLKAREADLGRARAELDRAVAEVPNLVHPAAPDGLGEEENVVAREVGDRPIFDFPPKDHLDLGEALDLIDIPRAAKVSGTRFGILKGRAALLEMSLMRFALDRVTSEGFVPVIPPVLVRRDALFGTGFFPSEEEQAYAVPEDDLYLVGTSEVPLAAMHADEILPFESLPLRYGGFSSCFRREAGTYGKDTRGIIRVHQFEKVEMFVYSSAETSEAEHERLLTIQESIFQAIEVPYRVVDVCAGDLGAPYARKFDLEAWLPGSDRWLEVTSTSNALDYQARRLSIRTRRDGEVDLVHTLNGTAITNRAIVAILENHQQQDGSIRIPPALERYTGFDRIP
jgi:seryl-tRNA synthetase